MMAIPHMVTGAAIGRVLRRWWLAYPTAFASHFLLDTVPHIDSHGLFGVKHGATTPLEAAAGIADFLVGAAVVGLAVARQPWRRIMFGAAVLAVLIDLMEYVPPFGPWFQRWPRAAWLTGFHHRVQHNLTTSHWLLGAGTQVAVFALGLAICLSLRRRRERPVEKQAAA